MEKFIVSIFSYHNGDNRMFYIQSKNSAEAAKQAFINHCPEEFKDVMYLQWVNDLGNTLEEVSANAINAEFVINVFPLSLIK